MRFQTDKIEIGFLPTYLRVASMIGTAGRVCEVGVREGHSLEMWQALFPHGVIVGVDDDSEITARYPAGTTRVCADQTDTDLPHQLREICPAYDLVVDDASHDGIKTRKTLDLLWPLVAGGGWYAVEDWTVGFPWCGTHDDSMLSMARHLVDLLDRGGDVESIEYRHGLILLRKHTRVAR